MFGKFMNKKFFHPTSYPNQKQKWIHERRRDANKKNEEEKQATYQKEQESYQSRLLSAKSTGEKLKLDLNFMYDAPPGMRKDSGGGNDEENEEEEVKFEWQKTAPRSKYVKDLGLDCQDQPFGVCVRNIRCFTCRGWGHQNTDRECPLFFSNVNSEANISEEKVKSQAQSLRLSDPLRLVAAMKKQHGITLKKTVIGQEINPMAENQQLIDSEEENSDLGESDLAYIESLTDKQKKKLLKSLNKLERSEKKKHKHKKKKEKDKNYDHKQERKRKRDSSPDSSPNVHPMYMEQSKKRKHHEKSDQSGYIRHSKNSKTKHSTTNRHRSRKHRDSRS